MMNFLESAGFSRANPYYVVQQGKVPSPSLPSMATLSTLLLCLWDQPLRQKTMRRK